jgi:hypothetical protein
MTERLAGPRATRDVYVDFRELVDDHGIDPAIAAHRLGTTTDAMLSVKNADQATARRNTRRAAAAATQTPRPTPGRDKEGTTP